MSTSTRKFGRTYGADARSALRELAGQFSKFSLVGVVGTISHYSVMALLIEVVDVDPVPATVVGFLASAIVSYFLNYRITFVSTADHAQALPRFIAVGTVGLGMNAALVGVLTGIAAVHWLIAQMIATLTVLCWNFVANRVWTFSRKGEMGEDE
jgi:putative flippase GtrA